MKFDPESYTISIRKEEDDGETFYVGRVAEFPNISSYEDSFEEAHALVIDSINTLKRIADDTHEEFPLPYPAPEIEFSGRVTLRLSKSLHAKVSKLAAQEDISVNQYLVTAIATHVGEVDGISRVVSEAVNLLAEKVAIAWRSTQSVINNAITPVQLSNASMLGGLPNYYLGISYQGSAISGVPNQELVALILKSQGIHEGHWHLAVKLGFSALNIAQSKDGTDAAPAGAVSFTGVRIVSVPQPAPFTVDASKVNPKRTTPKKAAPKK